MGSKRYLLLAIFVLTVIVAGCSKSPVDEFNAAKSLIEDARSNEASEYAPEFFAEVNDTLNAATVEITKQDEKFAPLRSYGRSRELIASASALARQLNDTTVARKEEVRRTDTDMIKEIDSLIAAVRSKLESAPKGKGSAVDIKVMRADIDAAVTALGVATEDVEMGRYLDAKSKLSALKERVQVVDETLAAASKKTSKKR